MLMIQRTATTTRFRCGHCGNRLVMQNRHLRRLVACHACGRTTHPVAKRLARVQTASKPAASKAIPAQPALQTPVVNQTVAPARPAATLELSAAPLAPLVLVGVTGAAFFAAISVMSYVGGFLSALLLVTVAAVGLRWLKRGTVSVRARLDQIEAVRLRHGSLRVIAMLFAWLWSQPAGRKPWACLLMLFWGMLYAPYCVSGMLLPSPRRELARVAA